MEDYPINWYRQAPASETDGLTRNVIVVTAGASRYPNVFEVDLRLLGPCEGRGASRRGRNGGKVYRARDTTLKRDVRFLVNSVSGQAATPLLHASRRLDGALEEERSIRIGSRRRQDNTSRIGAGFPSSSLSKG